MQVAQNVVNNIKALGSTVADKWKSASDDLEKAWSETAASVNQVMDVFEALAGIFK
jgi:hypothetical protein